MNIFIDAEDMEERYGEELYKEYLERENKELKQKIEYYENFEINKTVDKIRLENNKRFKEQQEELESLKQINEEHQRINGELRVENERLNNKEQQIIRKLEDLIIVGEQVENEWAVDICKMIIKELKGSDKE